MFWKSNNNDVQEKVMSQTYATADSPQLTMPGMPEPRFREQKVSNVLGCCNVAPGEEVIYLGKVHGGPRFGARGRVTKTLRQRAVVDMGESGVWNIPYYFLTTQQKAA
jgi:hypothetical protein